jgi:alkylation response protein AidB-like acyl-CoA dehydrogenase
MDQELIAGNETGLAACRALLWQQAAQGSQGIEGTEESSRAKVFIGKTTCRFAGRAMQLAGGAGVAHPPHLLRHPRVPDLRRTAGTASGRHSQVPDPDGGGQAAFSLT